MNKISKLNYDNFLIENKEYYGGNQEWYQTLFQKKAGCGPTTASTIIMYESKKYYTKNEFISLMNTMWKYITPTLMGLNKIEYYEEGFNKFVKENNINLSEKVVLNISKNFDERPTIKELYEYLDSAIKKDHPVAFLNLDNGSEKNLDEWHWVAIAGIKFDEKEENLYATIVDEGVLKNINLSLWINTSKRDGGFIYFK